MIQELLLDKHDIQRRHYLIVHGLIALMRAIFEMWGEPIINYSTKAIVIELIKQNVVIDGFEGFFKINEYSKRSSSCPVYH